LKKVFKYKKKLHLEQGKVYLFKLHKRILSPDGNDYFVMVDPFYNKHLVPVKYYYSYNLENGKNYMCKVDKINCYGRIFIEPPHPFYRENKNYLFKFSKILEEKHKSGNTYSYYLFQGENKYSAFFNVENYKLPKNLISGLHSFRVKKITKGKVYIE